MCLLDFRSGRVIRFDNVSFAYDANPDENSLKNISLTIPDGECVLLTGPSGCGKSTMLRLLNGLIPEFYAGKRSGNIIVDGTSIAEKGVYDLVGKIGTVFQNPRSQFFNVDTTSELAFGCENLAMPEDEILSGIDRTVRNFKIESLMDRDIFELSGGEKQKIACASVDVLRPEIILLDEPSANLDYNAAEALRSLIACWKSEGKTILIAEHRLGYIWDMADRVVILEEGCIRKDMQEPALAGFSQEDLTAYGLRTLDRVSPLALVKPSSEGGKSDSGNILLTGFTYAYKDKKAVLSIDEMRIKSASVTAIVGANGAGKTTFLECLCGILKNKGIMSYGGKSYNSKTRLKEIFMVMQDTNHQLFTESVLDEVLISMPEEDETKAKRILDDVELLPFAQRHPMSLSGGQKQRLAIACGVASKRPFLLLDEPTSGLDLRHMKMVADILKRLKNEGRTIITVTHDSEFILSCCDDVVRLEGEAYE